jgi:hypothetical protein
LNTLAPIINKYLKALYDTEDPVYRALIADETGIPASIPTAPSDMNIGAIGNSLEWNRRLTMSLIKQLRFDQCEGVFLTLMIDDFLNFMRASGETNAQYKERVIDIVLGPKISPAAIIYNARPYSTAEPYIAMNDNDMAYADVSYADCYETFQLTAPAAYVGTWVLPAVSRNVRGMIFFFILYVENTPDDQMSILMDKINSLIAAGTEFEVQVIFEFWPPPILIGSGLSIPNTGYPELAALNETDVAFIDSYLDELRCYRFNGSTWSLVGSGLSISGVGYPALTSLNETDVAFIDSYLDELRCYRFNGSTWSLVGSGLSISGANIPALAALNETDVAFFDMPICELRCYRFNGSTWSLVGSGLSISGANIPALAALNETDVAFFDNAIKELRCYRFNGSTWSQLSSGLSISGVGYPALTSLNETDVAFIDSSLDELRCYRTGPHPDE